MSELKARVATLIRARRQARRQFSREIVVQPAGITIQPEDEAFLERVLAVVEAHLGDSDFGAGAMADAVDLSRHQLERRLTQAAGETPAERNSTASCHPGRRARIPQVCKILRSQIPDQVRDGPG